MTTAKSLACTAPLVGAVSGTALSVVGLTWSPVAMYFVLPVMLVGIRFAAILGTPVVIDYRTACVLLAVLTPVCFALYGALLALPNTRRGRFWIGGCIVAANAIAAMLMAL